jgi:predicted O-methyltransferase YrrM
LLGPIKALIPKSLRAKVVAGRQRRQRLNYALSYYAPKIAMIHAWMDSSREVSNYTYDLVDANKKYLASFVSAITGLSYEVSLSYIRELDGDEELRKHIREKTEQHDSKVADPIQHYGRRLGWYALARATKPKVIVETGVEKGLGSCVLAKALAANAEEGHVGQYFGTDSDPGAGYLFTRPYADAGKILYGDSIESLTKLDVPIDLFINDSDHSADYEAREYQTIKSKLSENALIIGDNAHVTACLQEFAVETGRAFLFFREVPKDHWYPGGGIGVAFKKE